MSWGEIKKAINSTVGTNKFKPLDQIVREAVASTQEQTQIPEPQIAVNEDTGVVSALVYYGSGYVTEGIKVSSFSLNAQGSNVIVPTTETQVAVSKGTYTTGDIYVAGVSNTGAGERYDIEEVSTLPTGSSIDAHKIYLYQEKYYMPAFDKMAEKYNLYECKVERDNNQNLILIPYFAIADTVQFDQTETGTYNITPPGYDGVKWISFTAPENNGGVQLNNIVELETKEQMFEILYSYKESSYPNIIKYVGTEQGPFTGDTFVGDVGYDVNTAIVNLNTNWLYMHTFTFDAEYYTCDSKFIPIGKG